MGLQPVKILAIDIGAGTEDILLYDDEKESIESCVKIILPSPSKVFATNVREATRLCKDIFVKGDVVGGGALSSALINHVQKGLRVVMTEKAAYTVRNGLEQVRQLGIEITAEKDEPIDFEGVVLIIEEVNITKLQGFLTMFNETLSDVDVVAIAVQDHGVFPKGMSNRRFRIRKMEKLLKRCPKPEALAFKEGEIPHCFLRMRSAAAASRRQLPEAEVLLMDTSIAAIIRCLKDPVAGEASTVLTINVGNDGGHGLFFLAEPPSFYEVERILATGSNRSILTKTNLLFTLQLQRAT